MYVVMKSLHNYDTGEDDPLWYTDTEAEAESIVHTLVDLNLAYKAAWDDFTSKHCVGYHDLVEDDVALASREDSLKKPSLRLHYGVWLHKTIETYRKGLSRPVVLESILDQIGATGKFRNMYLYDEDANYSYIKLEKFSSD